MRPKLKSASRRGPVPQSLAIGGEHGLDLDALRALAASRARWQPLVRDLVAAELVRFLPGAASPPARWLEIGCGDGQLRAWLPSELRARTLHSDVRPIFLQQIRRREPTAELMCADVGALPLADDTAEGIVSLCVLDSLPDDRRSRDEILRVLRPGGTLVHALDTTTDLAPLLPSIVQKQRVLLPNFLTDLAALPRQARPFGIEVPPQDRLDDFVLAPRDQLAPLVAHLAATRHPIGEALSAYLDLFDPKSFDATQAAAHLQALTSRADTARALSQMLGQLYVTLHMPQYRQALPLDLEPFSSLRRFEERLGLLFAAAEGFEKVFSGIVSRRDRVLRPHDVPRACRFASSWVGQQVWRDVVPEPLPETTLVEEDGQTDGRDRRDSIIREVGVHFFVVRKAASVVRRKA
jgi:SAM-dependent methyltransferase